MKAAEQAADPERHAIEARVSAEDPSRDFAPAPGRITRWREPGGPGVRVDSGVELGTTVSAEYDPLLAKVMVVAPDRPMAIARLARAIDEWETGGIQTTLPFHRWLVRHPAFTNADLRTDLVARDWEPGPLREAAGRVAAAAVAAAMATGDGTAGPERGTDRSPDGWTQAARREATERWR
jgi:acetyl-CoA/propionyl-CoA carboxylase biotin carboxyl carrier protein